MPEPLISVLAFPFPLLSHYLRTLEVAKALGRGFEVRFASSPRYDSFVSEAGFGLFATRGFDASRVMEQVRRFDFSWLNQKEIERVAEAHREAIREHKPAFVLGDADPALRIAAAAEGVVCINLLNAYMSPQYATQRKIASAHPAARFQEKLPPGIWNFILRHAERAAFRSVHKPFRRLRRKWNLKQERSFLNEYEGDLTLLCDAPSLFPQKELPGNYKVVGPLYYGKQQPGNELLIPRQAELDAIAFLKSKPHRILASMGSSGDTGALDFLTAESFQDCAIAVTGDESKALQAPHIRNFGFLNNAALLAHCDLLICHGGNGTLYQALAAGVPVLCQTAHFEQEWNAQQVTANGYGVLLNDCKSQDEKVQLTRMLMGQDKKKLLDIQQEIQQWNLKGFENLAAWIAEKILLPF